MIPSIAASGVWPGPLAVAMRALIFLRAEPKRRNKKSFADVQACGDKLFFLPFFRGVYKQQILIHTQRVRGTLKQEQLFRSNDAMLNPGFKMERVPGLKFMDCERLFATLSPQQNSSPLLYLQMLILLRMFLKS